MVGGRARTIAHSLPTAAVLPTGPDRIGPRMDGRIFYPTAYALAVPFFAALDPADPASGGKARSLARLAQAGLAVPAAFVVTDDLYRALRATGPLLPGVVDAAGLVALDAAAAAFDHAPMPAGFADELGRRLAALGSGRFAVRSSFADEDLAGVLGAGVYESRVDVAADEVAAAVRQVLRSALSAGAVAYELAHGGASGLRAVLIHRYVIGDASGGAALAPGQAPVIDARIGQPSEAARRSIVEALTALAVRYGAVETEWSAADAAVTWLQMRPYRAPPPPRLWPGFSELDPALRDGWRWDAAHNPLPLSPAQAGLVALVSERCRVGYRQRVIGNYLFVAAGGARPEHSLRAGDVRAAFDRLRGEIEVALAGLGPVPALEPALELFVAAYGTLFGEIQPAARRGRAALETFLRANLLDTVVEVPALLGAVESLAQERRRAARAIAVGSTDADRASAVAVYLASFGDEAPVWDVAEPTYAEAPAALGGYTAPVDQRRETPWQTTARAILQRLPRMARLAWKDLLPTARACVAVGEDDDWLYARLQATVRRALLAVGERLVVAGVLDARDDVFFLPFDRTRELAAGGATGTDARPLVAAARAAHAAAMALPPPLTGDGSDPAPDLRVLRGAGTGGRAVGRVHLHRPGGPPPPRDAILVATTLLPTELPLLDVAAFVTETGGPLDHVATQARERGLPAVVGVSGATVALPAGVVVVVDADRGLVIRR